MIVKIIHLANTPVSNTVYLSELLYIQIPIREPFLDFVIFILKCLYDQKIRKCKCVQQCVVGEICEEMLEQTFALQINL